MREEMNKQVTVQSSESTGLLVWQRHKGSCTLSVTHQSLLRNCRDDFLVPRGSPCTGRADFLSELHTMSVTKGQ